MVSVSSSLAVEATCPVGNPFDPSGNAPGEPLHLDHLWWAGNQVAMMPPFIRRCPECGHVSLSRRFESVDDDPNRVECPACGHRFEPTESPWLN